MKISVVIATLDRPEHVRTLLASLVSNTRRPDEVVIVEQGNIAALELVVQPFEQYFPIQIVFEKEKSLAIARERGMRESSGDVLIFCDDDIEFNLDYVTTVYQYLLSHSHVLGLTGSYMHNAPAWTMRRWLGTLFCVYSLKQQNVVLPSGAYDYVRGSNLRSEQIIEWLYGCNMVLRRKVFELGFGFETRFTRWSYGEDVIATYPIYKRFPNSLRYLPDLKVVHHEGSTQKLLNEQALRMKFIYRYIFWRQEVYEGKWWRACAYVWSQVGLSGLEFLQHPSWRTIRTLVDTYRYLVSNQEAIMDGRVDFNDFILQN